MARRGFRHLTPFQTGVSFRPRGGVVVVVILSGSSNSSGFTSSFFLGFFSSGFSSGLSLGFFSVVVEHTVGFVSRPSLTRGPRFGPTVT